MEGYFSLFQNKGDFVIVATVYAEAAIERVRVCVCDIYLSEVARYPANSEKGCWKLVDD